MTMTWVVMEAASPSLPSKKVWAWCLSTGHAGFDDVSFTELDGVTPVDAPEGYRLGAFVFSVPAQ